MVGRLAWFDLDTAEAMGPDYVAVCEEGVRQAKAKLAKVKEKDEANDALAKRKEARMKAMKAKEKAKAKAQANKNAGKVMAAPGRAMKAMKAMKTMKTVKKPACVDADNHSKSMRAMARLGVAFDA